MPASISDAVSLKEAGDSSKPLLAPYPRSTSMTPSTQSLSATVDVTDALPAGTSPSNSSTGGATRSSDTSPMISQDKSAVVAAAATAKAFRPPTPPPKDLIFAPKAGPSSQYPTPVQSPLRKKSLIQRKEDPSPKVVPAVAAGSSTDIEETQPIKPRPYSFQADPGVAPYVLGAVSKVHSEAPSFSLKGHPTTFTNVVDAGPLGPPRNELQSHQRALANNEADKSIVGAAASAHMNGSAHLTDDICAPRRPSRTTSLLALNTGLPVPEMLGLSHKASFASSDHFYLAPEATENMAKAEADEDVHSDLEPRIAELSPVPEGEGDSATQAKISAEGKEAGSAEVPAESTLSDSISETSDEDTVGSLNSPISPIDSTPSDGASQKSQDAAMDFPTDPAAQSAPTVASSQSSSNPETLVSELHGSTTLQPRPSFRKLAVRIPDGPSPGGPPSSKVTKMSIETTLQLYKANALKSNDDKLKFSFAKFCLEESGKASEPALKERLLEEAYAVLRELSRNGNSDAMYTLGQAYFDDRQYSLAYTQLLNAAKRSHPGAMYLAAMLNEKGAGTKKSYRVALDFYTKSAQAGYRPALYRLGMIELHGHMGGKRDVRKAVTWFKRGAAVADKQHPECLYELAKIFEKGVPPHIQEDEPYAFGLYAEAAELEYPQAQYKLAQCLEFGRLTCSRNMRDALYWYGRAAENGNADAQFVLAGWYLHGFDNLLPQNEHEAYAWTYRAAKQNHAEAQYAVGYFCEKGVGCVKSEEKALQWYQIAAKNGETRAIAKLEAANQPIPISRASKSSKGRPRPAVKETGSSSSSTSASSAAKDLKKKALGFLRK